MNLGHFDREWRDERREQDRMDDPTSCRVRAAQGMSGTVIGGRYMLTYPLVGLFPMMPTASRPANANLTSRLSKPVPTGTDCAIQRKRRLTAGACPELRTVLVAGGTVF